jgi:hypothetical protein
MHQNAQGAPLRGMRVALIAKVAQLEAKVEHLSDRQQIIDVFRRYTREAQSLQHRVAEKRILARRADQLWIRLASMR